MAFLFAADKHDPSLVPKQIPSFFGLPTLPFNIFNDISDVEDQENKYVSVQIVAT